VRQQPYRQAFRRQRSPALNPQSPPPLTPRIKNPKYKGKWEAPDIDNPEYKADPSLHLIKDIKYVGFELWQVKSGSIFDNIIVTDDLAAAKKLAEETFKKNKDAEKAAMDKIKKVRRAWCCLGCCVCVGGGVVGCRYGGLLCCWGWQQQ